MSVVFWAREPLVAVLVWSGSGMHSTFIPSDLASVL